MVYLTEALAWIVVLGAIGAAIGHARSVRMNNREQGRRR